MATTFLSANIWPELRRLAKSKSRRALVAVPFVGRNAARQLALRAGDILVTKFDEAAIRQGLVSPHAIVAFIQRGVNVYSVSNLHAKVFVFGRRAIVGSANVSSLS